MIPKRTAEAAPRGARPRNDTRRTPHDCTTSFPREPAAEGAPASPDGRRSAGPGHGARRLLVRGRPGDHRRGRGRRRPGGPDRADQDRHDHARRPGRHVLGPDPRGRRGGLGEGQRGVPLRLRSRGRAPGPARAAVHRPGRRRDRRDPGQARRPAGRAGPGRGGRHPGGDPQRRRERVRGPRRVRALRVRRAAGRADGGGAAQGGGPAAPDLRDPGAGPRGPRGPVRRREEGAAGDRDPRPPRPSCRPRRRPTRSSGSARPTR